MLGYGALSITETPTKDSILLTALFDQDPNTLPLPDSGSSKRLSQDAWEKEDSVTIDRLRLKRLTTVFGTDHPTTQICLTLLKALKARQKNQATILDVGTGTGVLSLWALANTLGAVTSIDIDPTAITLAKDNARLNGLPDTGFICQDLAQFVPEQPFELVMANIPTEVHPILHQWLKSISELPQTLLISGFQSTNRQTVLSPYTDLGYRETIEKDDQDWIGVVMTLHHD